MLPIIRIPSLASKPSTSFRKKDLTLSETRLSTSSRTSRQGLVSRAFSKIDRMSSWSPDLPRDLT